VQVVPHITNEIKERIKKVTNGRHFDVVICEIGGTVGDIEGLPFLEAVRQFRKEVGRENAVNIHVTLVPYLDTTGEFKTKPTQHSVKELRSIGIHPEIIICRSKDHLSDELKDKISLFCDTAREAVIGLADIDSIYEVPLSLAEEKLDEIVAKYLNLPFGVADLSEWRDVVDKVKHPTKGVRIAIVGKYTELSDAYLSIVEALKHGGVANKIGIDIRWINSEELDGDNEIEPYLRNVQGIVVPGGFGIRGVEGKIKAIKYARENKIPYLGLCLGMQCAVVEFARNVCKLKGAHSTEFDEKTQNPVISLMSEQQNIKNKGGTMRLGAYPCRIKKGTLLDNAYEEDEIQERHRHRYEFNNKYKKVFEDKGMVLSGINPNSNLVEVIELVNHPWFLATQYHPEFKSRPTRPHPLFRDFIAAATNLLKEQKPLFTDKADKQ